MKIENYRKRIADNKIEHYLKLFGAISIEGPKYCGKTWAGRYHSNSEILLHKTTVIVKFYCIKLLESNQTMLNWQKCHQLLFWKEKNQD